MVSGLCWILTNVGNDFDNLRYVKLTISVFVKVLKEDPKLYITKRISEHFEMEIMNSLNWRLEYSKDRVQRLLGGAIYRVYVIILVPSRMDGI